MTAPRSSLEKLLPVIRARAYPPELPLDERREISRVMRAIGWCCMPLQDMHNREHERATEMLDRYLGGQTR